VSVILASQEAEIHQEDCSSKPAQTNSLRDPISKELITKKTAGGMVQSVDPEFKPQYRKKERRHQPNRQRKVKL
jgi:hypothetical protein